MEASCLRYSTNLRAKSAKSKSGLMRISYLNVFKSERNPENLFSESTFCFTRSAPFNVVWIIDNKAAMLAINVQVVFNPGWDQSAHPATADPDAVNATRTLVTASARCQRRTSAPASN